MHSTDLLRDLIAFPTISADPNRGLIDYCAGLLRDVGADVHIIKDNSGQKANLYATIGPRDRAGVLLSGHTDVVPVEGQNWTVAPFEMTERDGKFFGRGAADMKGFVASAMAAALTAGQRDLATPLHLALSYDEEIGCVGVRSMLDMLAKAPFCPKFCIVGEPTDMTVATGHKGKTAARLTCRGKEAHSALAPTGLNAIHMACDMVTVIRQIQDETVGTTARDLGYDVPYTTLHVGQISGGVALNIVPNTAQFNFEIRNLPDDDPDHLLRLIRNRADTLLAPLQSTFPEAGIDIDVTNTYPPLSTAPDADVVSFVKSLTGSNATIKVAFGTEGGLFSTRLGIPTVVCGPGSMAQGHKPDEFVTRDQLDRCDAMLDVLLHRLEVGL
ncbi:MAG: acetylornithine deacetylase [Pseudomonadota bacterium]